MSTKLLTTRELRTLSDVLDACNSVHDSFGPTVRGYVRLNDEEDSYSYQIEFNVDSDEHVIVF